MRDETKDLDQTLDLLGRLLPDHRWTGAATMLREINAAPALRARSPVKSDLTWEEFARVNVHAHRAARRHGRHGRGAVLSRSAAPSPT